MGGFSRDEVLLIYGLASVGFGLAALAVGQLDRLPDLIRSGELDAMLLRPPSVLGRLCAADIALRRIGRVAAGAVTLGYALFGAYCLRGELRGHQPRIRRRQRATGAPAAPFEVAGRRGQRRT